MAVKAFDIVVLGATGYTGRQVVRSLKRRASGVAWTVAGRDRAKLQALGAPAAALVADLADQASLEALASQAKVVVNTAGPYARTGEAVVQACIAHGTHHLDLSGETFWVREMIDRHHAEARAAGVRVVTSCGYEALPFDLATLWGATRLALRHRQPCQEVKIIVGLRGLRAARLSDFVSGGTVASLKNVLELDHSDCLRNPACLLPEPDSPHAKEVARLNALRFVPQYDNDVKSVTAPTLPAPFVNPPLVLRSVALIDDASVFAADFRYREALQMASLVPRPDFLPPAATLPLQWAAAASLSAPLANLSAAVAGPLQFERDALARLVDLIAPSPGSGPREDSLDDVGWSLDVFARAASGAAWHGRVEADGHPGYRSTAEMIVTVALGLADGSLGTERTGVVPPAAALGIDAVDALGAAGMRFFEA